jgi:predicted small lipoprotein YifL
MVALRILLAAMLVLTIAACGKRGDLTPPAGNEYPRQYPKQ